MGMQTCPIHTLEPQDQEELERRATEQAVGPSALVRLWIKDRLRQAAEQAPAGT